MRETDTGFHKTKVVLLPAVIACVISAMTATYALMPSVTGFAWVFGLNLASGFIVTIVCLTALTLDLPNELRGVTFGLYTLINAFIGISLAPTAVALTDRALGGDQTLGWAIAVIGAPRARRDLTESGFSNQA